MQQHSKTQQKPTQAATAKPHIETKKPEAVKESKSQKPTTKLTKSQKSRTELYDVSAYALGDSSTPSHGITASGERVQQGRTVACARELPFGTEIYIPSLDHTYVCTDRGGAIKSGKLDIYFESIAAAKRFGRQTLPVEVRRK